MKTIKSIEDFIGLANQSKSNRYFFSNEAMKEFNSSIENWRVINDKSILFITREKYPLGTVGYTVRLGTVLKDDVRIDNVTPFLKIKTLKTAEKKLFQTFNKLN